MTDCIAVVGGKGGCGKTTTAVGLASALSVRGQSSLVVDADREMPDLHLVAGVDDRPGLTAVAAGRDPLAVAHRVPETPAMSVLPAAGADGATAQAALARLRGVERPILLDCPAGASRDAALPLRAADRTLLVTTATRESLRDAAKTAAMARELAASPLGAVVVDSPASEGTVVDSQDCQRLFGCERLGRVPRVDDPPLSAPAVRTVHKQLAKKVFERNI